MEELLVDQEGQGRLILNFFENMKKRVAKDKMTVDYLESRLQLLQDYWVCYFNTHKQLSRCDDPKIKTYIESQQFEKVEAEFVETRAALNGSIKKLKGVGAQDVSRRDGDQGSQEAALALRSSLDALPKLNIPKFSGNQLEWPSFRDMFCSMVHDVPNLSKVMKLQHLKQALTGDAAKRLKNIPITDDHYDDAWGSLVRRYDNKRVMLSAHMRNLLACTPAASKSVEEILRLLDTATEAIRAFTSLGRPVAHWDDWLVHLVVYKLDSSTREDWEQSLDDTADFPTYASLSDFLERRVRALETARFPGAVIVSTSSSVPHTKTKRNHQPSQPSIHVATPSEGSRAKASCISCQGTHFLSYCQKFKRMSVPQRRHLANQHTLCSNCLRKHPVSDCPSEKRCFVCNAKHHTLLHEEINKESNAARKRSETTLQSKAIDTTLNDQPTTSTASLSAHITQQSSVVLLATAMVTLEAPDGSTLSVRALLDQGSQASFITERVAQLLRLQRTRISLPVTGIGATSAGVIKYASQLSLRTPREPGFQMLFQAYIMPKLTNVLPSTQVPRQKWKHLRGLPLADPNFGEPREIDCLLGAEMYSSLIREGVRSGHAYEPTAQNNILGWILSGSVRTSRSFQIPSAVTGYWCSIEPTISEQLRSFWELEELQKSLPYSAEEKRCEDHFVSTHTRDESGRFIVRLPWKSDIPPLFKNSRAAAIGFQRRYERNQKVTAATREAYVKFMAEYEKLGHMERVQDPEEDAITHAFYMPHHAVVKAHDPSKKIRVVFNASYRPMNEKSLNDFLLPGPRLQPDLWVIISRWRFNRFVFACDIVKMYRQIRMNSVDADTQRLVWRADPSEELREYRLLTVTYGTASAPYLALRVIQQLAKDERHRYPLGAEVLETNTYVDDVLAGADTFQSAQTLQEQVIGILASAGFELSKWASNSPQLIPDSAKGDDGAPVLTLSPQEDSVATLGLQWTPKQDIFHFQVISQSSDAVVTKRTILSATAQLFDPLGWVSPILITAKILLQDLWIAGVEWDEPVPNNLQHRWVQFRTNLAEINTIELPRWLQTTADRSTWQLHGFSDASERAYAAAIYLRTSTPDGKVKISLLIAKTKVAPVKVVTLPRLELCGALLLSRLLSAVVEQLNLQLLPVYAWTDSQVTLAWLQGHPSRWKPFVANRVSEILSTIPGAVWQHVPTKVNPADLGTRGVATRDLRDSDLWWKGPPFLQLPHDEWPLLQRHNVSEESMESELRPITRIHVAQVHALDELPSRFSSYTKLIRVTAYCLRFVSRLRQPNEYIASTWLTTTELRQARMLWIKRSQSQFYQSEIDCLAKEDPALPRSSSLLRLHPLLDTQGVLRVGGRLENAFLSYDEKHPITLHKASRLASLLVHQAHLATMHGGPMLTQSCLVRTYWIVRGRVLVRGIIRQCVRCTRIKGATQSQLMGDLPSVRVTPSRPFASTGVDYTGPILLRSWKGRGHKSYKGWICIFVCMVTRAVHIEVVSDYTSQGFLAAFRRFVSRRGRCVTLYSDNGTTFKGADRELAALLAATSRSRKDIATILSTEGTDWIYIPPHAPHFGGLWEASVRSVKHHIKRVLGESRLTFEEMTTLLTQIEACLNSRPISPLSEDPSDLAALTPGHFLIGSAITTVPEPPYDHDVLPRQRWAMITAMRDHFWRRWSKEYVHQLQQRSKWHEASHLLEEGSMVVIKDDLLPPTKWSLGRVLAVHPGRDGLARVATVRTATTTLQRPVAKLCLLPVKPMPPRPAADEQVDEH